MDNEKNYFFDDPKNIKRLLNVFYGICVLLIILDFVIHRHISHDAEKLWGFYGIYGFVGCVLLVIIAKWMRTFLMRPENYYDSDVSNQAENHETPDANEKPLTSESNKVSQNHVDD